MRRVPLALSTTRSARPTPIGEMVAEAVADGRFLVLTVPEVLDEIIERAADIDAHIDKLTS